MCTFMCENNCSTVALITLMLNFKHIKIFNMYQVHRQTLYVYYVVSTRNLAHSEDSVNAC